MNWTVGPDFWIGLIQIIWIDIILSGDNAVVIALAARSLPPKRRKQAVILGAGGAVVLRVLLILVATQLLELPYLRIVGGLLLLWIGVGLMGKNEEGAGAAERGDAAHGQSTWIAAVRTILIADVVMSLDNVIAVAAAAGGDIVLLAIGLAGSIPLVIFGSTLLMGLMARLPIIAVLGAALIGWVGGETLVNDVALTGWRQAMPWLRYAMAAVGAIGVVLIGHLLQRRRVSVKP
ncbi:MAG: YjbE family putative metal transport protein [Burkholderiaceae bacterium]|jgi:YjbE family integral membrane protein|nr:YjbE family putative metal transport protein [Burkholderiaceae bacterium]